uniref:ribosomal protein S4 n=1 Tax=Cryptomonas gyropyrenoidosa TaxID=233257 RepID=UPI0027AB2C9D|nr:ribosomal protein S4 [Cryptomonas gyropyrenoidosa]WFQ82679.1 ribosomal protein S4 [Cryptomonas gyropyrenoidosa]
MTKRLKSKYSVCKNLKNRYNNNLWGLKAKKNLHSVVRKTNAKKKRITLCGKLLSIKQSLKFFYSNLKEKNFKTFVKHSIYSSSKTINKLVSFAESRLDSTIYRSCLFSSFHEIRQSINHNFVFINGRCVTNPSRKLHKGDIITFKSQVLDNFSFIKALSARSIPNFIEVDFVNLTIVFLWDPKLAYYPVITNYKKIIRYYR